MNRILGLLSLSYLSPSLSSTLTYSYWTIETTASSSFPCGADHAYAAGVDSFGTIWIGEGVECHSDSIFSYKPSTDDFTTTECPSSCPITLSPVPQYYTQMSDRLYITDGRKFIYYDLAAQTGWNNLQHGGTNVKFPTRIEHDTQCIASTRNGAYLIGVGGILYSEMLPFNAVQVYDMNNDLWLSAPSLPMNRFGAGCIVHPYDDSLYVMGGASEFSLEWSDQFYKLYVGDMHNVASQSFMTYSDAVLALDHFGRLVAYETYLIALGGYSSGMAYIAAWDISSGSPQLLDASIEISGFTWGNAAHAVIGNRIYVFGDGLQGDLTNWQYIDLSLGITSCGSAGEALIMASRGVGHVCQCQSQCDGAYCNAIESVADVLNKAISSDVCDGSSVCCCSCPNCDGFIEL